MSQSAISLMDLAVVVFQTQVGEKNGENNLTRPAVATRTSSSGIKDSEISAMTNYYTT
jgi:hypothetical protein